MGAVKNENHDGVPGRHKRRARQSGPAAVPLLMAGAAAPAPARGGRGVAPRPVRPARAHPPAAAQVSDRYIRSVSCVTNPIRS